MYGIFIQYMSVIYIYFSKFLEQDCFEAIFISTMHENFLIVDELKLKF